MTEQWDIKKQRKTIAYLRKHAMDGGTKVFKEDWEKIYIKPDMFPAGQEPLLIHEDEHGTYYYEEEQPDDERLMAGDSNGGK